MSEKQCFKCQRMLPRSMFYANPKMADGLLGKCKDCTKIDVKAHYWANHEAKCAYERERARRPERKKAQAEALRRHRANNPDKYRARAAVGNAIRDGRLVRQPCACGNPKSQAHHDDYSKPLDVKWACFRCHREKEHGQRVARRIT